jgi:3-hydroxy-9,10-secoandrosta-1,3,5(10)-triene-9,17-dione monooxygenase reductase component
MPVGMTVGTFASVSLESPLVGFFPDRKSATWPKIERAGCFCVNVLAADQHDHCRLPAAKVENKFETLLYRSSGRRLPILQGVIAWIDCDLESVQEAGGHYFVLGRAHT